jgi:hypothetical protein
LAISHQSIFWLFLEERMNIFLDMKLQRGDKDEPDIADGAKAPRYEGRFNHGVPSDAKLVAKLQETLRTLGFGFIKHDSSGTFGPSTEMAVREFQIYAASNNIAKVNLQSNQKGVRFFDALLVHKEDDNEKLYWDFNNKRPLPASGVVNDKTAILLDYWLKNNLHCPVILTAFKVIGGSRTWDPNPDALNLWRYDELPDPTARVFARDFTADFRSLNDDRMVACVEVLVPGPTRLKFGTSETEELDFSNATADEVRDKLLPTVTANSDELEVVGPLGGPWDIRFAETAKCAFPPGCSCQQLSEPLLGGEATQGHVAPAAVIDPQVGR